MGTAFNRVTFRFGDFELDAAAYELRRSGLRLRLARQPMDLLLLLLERPGELVSREDIARRLWGEGVFVDTDAGIHTAVLRIRQALGSPGASSFIETVPGKGYRFVASVAVVPHAVPPASPGEVPAPERLSPQRHDNLPVDLTSFVGRRQELEDLRRLLAGARLLSLIGAGGVGKTRLALRFASELVGEFPGGVCLVDLGSLRAPDLIVQTIASTIGVRESPHRPVREAVLEYLRERRVLLVLDTCEHLVDACAELVEALLRGAPDLRIIATSREALSVPGEVIYRVPSLSLPGMSQAISTDALAVSEATELFIERAAAAQPAFRATEDNAGAIASICRRLDGIPLAIELAAARMTVLSPHQVEVRLGDRFRLLTGGARTSLPRQRTLEATVDWSYQLLSEVERLVLNRLAVFPASWTLEAAERICGAAPIDSSEMLDHLSRLVDKSLVVLDRDSSGEVRYRLLETVREYARQRLVQTENADLLYRRHHQFFFHEFRDSLTVLRVGGQLPRLQKLRVEQDNVRAALEWALASPDLADEAVELAAAMFWFWTKRGLFEEGRLWLERAVTLPAPATLRARAFMGLAHMHYFQGHLEATAACTAEALSLSRAADDRWTESFALFFQALVAFEAGQHDEAVARALEARIAATDELQHGGPLLVLANVALSRGDHECAQRLYDESVEVHRRAGEIWGMSILLSAAAGLRVVRGDFDRARVEASEAMSVSEALDDPRGLAWSLEVFAGLAAAGGAAETAARLWGASNALLERVGGSLVPTIGWIRGRYIQAARRQLGDAAFDNAIADGQASPAWHAVALARRQSSAI